MDSKKRRNMETPAKADRQLQKEIAERKQAELRLSESESRYRELVETMNDGLAVRDPKGRFSYLNQSLCQMLGYTRREMVGTPLSRYMDEANRKVLRKEMVKRRKGESSTYELTWTAKDGYKVNTIISAKGDYNAGGELLSSFAVVTDITPQKQAEDSLRKLNRAYKALSHCHQALVRTSNEQELLGEICRIIVDDCGYRMVWIGFTRHGKDRSVEPVAQAGFEDGYLDTVDITWSDTPRGRGPTGTAIRTRQPVVNENALTNPAFAPWRGEAVKRGFASSAALPLICCQNDVMGALNVYSAQPEAFSPEEIDLLLQLAGDLAYGIQSRRLQTQRKKEEEERRARIYSLESMERINRAIHQEGDLGEILWKIMKTVYSIFRCDRAWLLYPCDPNAPTFRVPVEVSRPKFPGAFIEDLDVPMKPGADVVCEAALASDGPVPYGPNEDHKIYPQLTEQFGVRSQMIMAIYPRTGKPWIFGMHQCSYPRTWTAEEQQLFKESGRRIGDALSSLLIMRNLRESEQRFHTVVEQAADAFFLCTPDGSIREVNQCACDSLGYTHEELLDMNLAGIDSEISPQKKDPLPWDSLPPGKHVTIESMHRRKDNSSFHVEIRMGMLELGEQQFLLALARDITERILLQQQLVQTQKMDSIGTLAGGIAHDFNNLLTVINGHAELLFRKLKEDSPFHRNITAIHQAGQRAGNLTRQLLAFSRKQVYTPTILDINDLITSLEKMMRRLIGEDINILMTLEPSIEPVKADPGQIEQILINLIVNARDALAECSGIAVEKQITIETGQVFLDETYVLEHLGSHKGLHVFFSVSDNGSGMADDLKNKIFEPFFTTKEKGKGTGLGLSTVYGIVKQNNGGIFVYSEVGRGSTFKIYWPAAVKESLHPAPEQKEIDIPGGSEAILIVEDDPEVRKFASESLTGLGYEVYEAADGEEAFYLLTQENLQVNLLLSDLVMPKMGGMELAKAIKDLQPPVKVLFTSGYTDNHMIRDGRLKEGVNFLPKPYSLESLAKKVREVLEK